VIVIEVDTRSIDFASRNADPEESVDRVSTS